MIFVTVVEQIGHLRASFAPASKVCYDQLFADLCEVELLVLDDLGSQQQTPWAEEKLFQLLNARYNGWSSTVLTANAGGLTALEARIRSHLMDAGLVQAVNLKQVGDYRQRVTR